MKHFKELDDLIRSTERAAKDDKLGAWIKNKVYITNLVEISTNKRLKSVAGRAWFKNAHQTIELADWAVLQWPLEDLKVLALHEYAHIIAGPSIGHSHMWHTIFRHLLDFNGLHHVETTRCYSNSQRRRKLQPSKLNAMIDECKTMEECLSLRHDIRKYTTGAERTKLLNRVSDYALTLV